MFSTKSSSLVSQIISFQQKNLHFLLKNLRFYAKFTCIARRRTSTRSSKCTSNHIIHQPFFNGKLSFFWCNSTSSLHFQSKIQKKSAFVLQFAVRAAHSGEARPEIFPSSKSCEVIFAKPKLYQIRGRGLTIRRDIHPVPAPIRQKMGQNSETTAISIEILLDVPRSRYGESGEAQEARLCIYMPRLIDR